MMRKTRRGWVGGLVLIVFAALVAGGMPYSDSGQFLLDTFSALFEPNYAESPDFGVATTLPMTEPGFDESNTFALDTNLSFSLPGFATAAPMAMDTRRINRAWGDSEAFAYNNPSGCVGEYTGSYAGSASGVIEAYLDCDHSLSVTFVSHLGPVLFDSVAAVGLDGAVSGSHAGATMAGTFDFSDCTGSGTWTYAGGYSGTWSMVRSAPGPCLNPVLTVVAPQDPHNVNGGIGVMAVLNTGGGVMPWTASVLPGAAWLIMADGVAGTNAGLIFYAYTANPNADPRTGTIRVSAPGAAPPFVDVTVTQSGTAPPPQVTHFEFAPIEGPYMVGEQIPVTITSRNAQGELASGYNRSINLRVAPVGRASPRVVPLVNGSWTGAVSIDEALVEAHLIAGDAEIVGTSNAFDVADVDASTGRIAGLVTIGNPPAPHPNGGHVLVERGDLLLSIPPIGTDGRFVCPELPPGAYTLTAQYGSIAESVPVDVQVRSGATRTVELHLRSNRQRVLLVPGLLGSTLRTASQCGFPRVGDTGTFCDDLQLYDPRCPDSPAPLYEADVWRSLRRSLGSEFDVVEVPWDWRRPVDQAWRICLRRAIRTAKRDPTDKVHIVAHSMGGLLARAYIQSDDYDEDVDRLAIIGTPNEGSPVAYYLWEGGNPEAADRVTRWYAPLIPFGLAQFYASTIDRLYADTLLLPQTYRSLSNVDTRDFLHNHVRSIGDLMAVYPFIATSDVGLLHQWHGAQDSVLSSLNSGAGSYPNLWRLVPASGDPDLVRTRLFLSSSEDTLVSILVGLPGSNGLYPQGRPRSSQHGGIATVGDGTVPAHSVRSRLGVSTHHECTESSITCDAGHTELMTVYADSICEFLNDDQPCQARGERLAEVDEAPTAMLSVSISGRVQPRLAAPGGATSGVDLATGNIVQDIDSSQVIVSTRGALISVADPVDGGYEVQLTGMTDDLFSIEAIYGVEQASTEEFVQGIYHDGVIGFGIDLDSNAEPTIVLQEPLGRPENVASQESGSMTQLVWDAAVDPLVTGYNVYARPDDQPKFALLGTTTETSFDTGHPWNVAGSAPTWHYFVVSVADVGTESFFTDVVENRHPLVARFSAAAIGAGEPTDPETMGEAPLTVAFTDESAGEALAWAWDFDGDGAIDSIEQDPQFEYTLPGSYTVTLTVGGPEGTDTTVRPGAVVVGPLPEPNLPGDFNGDGVVDLLDYAAFSERMSGPSVDPTLAGWYVFDLDYDYDVDLDDLHLWVQHLVGSSPADPG